MIKFRLAICAAAAAVLAASASHAADFITNGDFETGVLSPWIGVGPGAVGVATENDYTLCCGFSTTHPSNHVAAFGAGGTGPTESITQTFTDILGQNYLLSFDSAGVGSSNSNTLDVAVGSASQSFTFTGTTNIDAQWVHRTVAFTGTGADSVTFTVHSFLNDDIDTLVDNVSIPGRVAGVPEPAGWALMITGFGLAGAAMRRRNVARA